MPREEDVGGRTRLRRLGAMDESCRIHADGGSTDTDRHRRELFMHPDDASLNRDNRGEKMRSSDSFKIDLPRFRSASADLDADKAGRFDVGASETWSLWRMCPW